MSAYYEFIIGSGFYECYTFAVKVDYPTTDYGALTDILIDNLEAQNHRNIVSWAVYELDELGECLVDKDDGETIYCDEWVQGGNHSRVLMHYGTFHIQPIDEANINDMEVFEAL